MKEMNLLFVLLSLLAIRGSQRVPKVISLESRLTIQEVLESTSQLYKAINCLKDRKYLKVIASEYNNINTAEEILISNDYADIEAILFRATKQGTQIQLDLSNEYYGQATMAAFFIEIKCKGTCNYSLSFEYFDSVRLQYGVPSTFYGNSMMVNNVFSFPYDASKMFLIVYAYAGRVDQIRNIDITYSNPESSQQVIKAEVSFYNGYSGTFAMENFDFIQGAQFKMAIKAIPYTFLTVGVREMNANTFIHPNENVIYSSFNYPMMVIECFRIFSGYSANPKDKFALNIMPHSNVELVIDNLETSVVLLPSHLMYSFEQLQHSKICFKPHKDTVVSASFQLINLERIEEYQSLYEPLTNGLIYSHFLPKGKVVYYQKRRYAEEGEISSMTLRVIKGNPKMFRIECRTYPQCSYNKEAIEQLEKEGKLIVSHRINDYYTIANPNKEPLAISPIKQLQVVYCEGEEDCDYYVTAFNQRDLVHIYPAEAFCLFQFKGKNNLFHFQIQNAKIKKLIIYLYALSGSVHWTFQQYPQQETPPVEFFLGSRKTVEYVPDPGEGDEGNTLIGSYDIEVTSDINSFFVLMFIPLYAETLKVIDVSNGITMLEYIKKEEKSKQFKLSNRHSNRKKHFLTSFLAMNCQIEVTFNKKPLLNMNDLTQHELTSDAPEYLNEAYLYDVAIKTMDTRSETCMLYVSGLELDDDSLLVVSEANPITIRFNTNVKHMSYLYPHPSIPGNVIINFIFDETAKVRVKVRVESGEFKEYTFKRDRKIIIHERTIEEKCRNTFLCNILISIELLDSTQSNEALHVQMLAKSQSKVPSFLKHNILRDDVIALSGVQYYYVQVGFEEDGEIIIDFDRGNGKIYAKIVDVTTIEPDADWNGRVKLPTAATADLMQFDPYTLKISYTKKETSKCAKGCEIFIGVESTDKYNTVNNYLFEYTIFSSIKSIEGKTIIPIRADDYITGTLANTINNNFYAYYSLEIPNETNSIIIDIQSEIAVMYVLYGKGYPTKEKHDFKFTSYKKAIFTIEKAALPGKPTEVKGKELTFAIGALALDKIYHAYYSFKVETPEIDLPKMIRVVSDMNYLCNVVNDNSYCDFAIPLHDYDEVTSLLLSASYSSLSHLALYANVVSAVDFDINFSAEQIKKSLPREGKAKFTSSNQLEKSYLSIESSELKADCYVLVSVFSTRITEVTFQSTFRAHISDTIINPSTKQLYQLFPNEKILFTLPLNNNYLIRVDRILGKGSAGFKGEEKLTLKESFDSISITSTSNEGNSIFEVNALEERFGFVIFYEIRPTKENFDEVFYAKTIGIVYRSTDFPILFYVRINDEYEDISVNIDFKTLIKAKAVDKTGELAEETFQILGVVTDKELILKKKRNKDVNPLVQQIVKGDYDQVVQTGKIYFKSKDIKAYESNSPKYLYISIAKTETNRNKYSFIHAITTTFPFSNTELIVKPNKYHFFNLIEGQTMPNIYQLRKEAEDDDKMQIEFSSASKQMTFALLKYSDYIKDKYINSTEYRVLQAECLFGRSQVVLDLQGLTEVLLSIFPRGNDHSIKSELDSNYIFRYRTTKDIETFQRYTLQNNGLIPFGFNMTDQTNQTFILRIKCLPILLNNKTNIPGKYILRVYPLSEYDTDSDPNALSLLIKKPIRLYSNETEGVELTVDMTLDNLPVERKLAFSIIAITREDSSMLSFMTIMDPLQKPPEEPKEKKDNFWLIIYISAGVIFALLIALFIGIWKCCRIRRKLQEDLKLRDQALEAEPILNDERQMSLNYIRPINYSSDNETSRDRPSGASVI